jgi:hypothetical protein
MVFLCSELAPKARSRVLSDWVCVGNPFKQSGNYVYHIQTWQFAHIIRVCTVLTVNSD